MMFVLQPVHCAVGRSFKSVLHRLIVVHVLLNVDCMFALLESDPPVFKMTQVIAAYVALKLIAEAWDLVLH